MHFSIVVPFETCPKTGFHSAGHFSNLKPHFQHNYVSHNWVLWHQNFTMFCDPFAFLDLDPDFCGLKWAPVPRGHPKGLTKESSDLTLNVFLWCKKSLRNAWYRQPQVELQLMVKWMGSSLRVPLLWFPLKLSSFELMTQSKHCH